MENLEPMRHSTAHLLAYAVTKLYPGTKVAIGPTVENGFYYDFEFPKPISENDFAKIEKEMEKLKKEKFDFKQEWISVDEAKKIFKDEPYKLEIISEIEKGSRDDFGRKGQVSIYRSGEFVDLCKGPHITNSSQIGYFKLLSLAGAYWKGNEKNKMLTRIYGTVFPTKEELDKYLWRIEEAKKRDHRKLGKDLGIFTISDEVGPGLVLWLPKGTIIKDELENWAKQTEKEWGYERVSTPEITKSGLYYTSGHLPYYKNDMYPPMKFSDTEEYYIRPMNCPHHHMVFKAEPRSYKELPLRLAEYGKCYRNEASGELFGLLRVRGMTMNDAHIYCTEEQAVDEFVKVMKLHQYYYEKLGITDYYLEMALRDPKHLGKYHGDEEMWKKAEKMMREAVKRTDIRMEVEEGSAAFYGPKIDFVIRSSIGRTFAISTNQIDLYMGKRFNLTYIDDKGKGETPAIIHRAPLGSSERFIGFLIEHYGGAFPLWLSPVQIVILPISERHLEHAEKIKNSIVQQAEQLQIRIEIDSRNETIGSKIRQSTLQKIPYLVIIGDKEAQSPSQEVSVRTREGKDLGKITLQNFIEKVKNEIDKKI